ncbi:hypothetical protein D3C75_1022540 [compost metagenome]
MGGNQLADNVVHGKEQQVPVLFGKTGFLQMAHLDRHHTVGMQVRMQTVLRKPLRDLLFLQAAQEQPDHEEAAQKLALPGQPLLQTPFGIEQNMHLLADEGQLIP